jgi:nucleoside-diphosphate-sugar epimerase
MAANLILGNGLLGSELIRQTGWDCATLEDGFDVLMPHLYRQFLSDHDCIINCIGFTTDHRDRERNIDLNFRAAVYLANWCDLHRKRYVHISTDIVYAGSPPFAREGDVPVHDPNWYAYAKLLADGYVQMCCKDYLLVRTAFKPRPFPFPVAFRKVGNFDYVDIIAGLIIRLIEKNVIGVYNVGTKLKTMVEHARETVPDIQLKMDSKFVDVSMNLEKMEAVLHGE